MSRGSESICLVRRSTPTLTQLVLKPTIYCYHRCSYCDLRQDYYSDLVAKRKNVLRLQVKPDSGRPANPGHMPLDMALHYKMRSNPISDVEKGLASWLAWMQATPWVAHGESALVG